MDFILSTPSGGWGPYRLTPRENGNNAFMRSYQIPEPFGDGVLRQIRIQPGMDLFIAKYAVRSFLHIDIHTGGPGFELGFCLSGETRVDIPGYKVESGRCGRLYRRRQDVTVTDAAKSYRLSVALVVTPRAFQEISQHDRSHLPPRLQLSADGLVPDEYLDSVPINTALLDVLHQILTPQSRLADSHIHYRSKAYELLSLGMHYAAGAGAGPDDSSRLCPRRVCQAAEILIHSMESPPSLFTLAKMLGTSHVTLNHEFRQAFGTTVFGYLRRVRLDKARELLEDGGASVTETSLAVGYNSLSTFSRAFFEQHGMSPSTCRQKGASG